MNRAITYRHLFNFFGVVFITFLMGLGIRGIYNQGFSDAYNSTTLNGVNSITCFDFGIYELQVGATEIANHFDAGRDMYQCNTIGKDDYFDLYQRP
jgi:hypothetical protein